MKMGSSIAMIGGFIVFIGAFDLIDYSVGKEEGYWKKMQLK